jgi:hypothetical protein
MKRHLAIILSATALSYGVYVGVAAALLYGVVTGSPVA